jgi:uncharacterized protein
VATPISSRERSLTVDVLRGAALCGVLIGNLYALYSGRWAQMGKPPELGLGDEIAQTAMSVLVEGKAQNLLTFLFGYGFAVQLLRARERGDAVAGLYVRRMLALLAIGWLHVMFLWWGDVTWGYAIAGFALLAFQRAGNVTRVVVGLVLAIVPFTIWVLVEGGRLTAELYGWDPPDWMFFTQSLTDATRSGDYGAIIWNHMRYALVWSGMIWTWYGPALVGRFLLGYVAGVQRWFDGEHRRLFRWMLAIGLAIGVPLAVLRFLRHHVIELPQALGSALYMIELLAIAAAYLAAISLLMQTRLRRVLGILAPAGRMPLTTYVMQSVFATSIFYGWGFGLETPGPAACLGLSLAIFALQIAIAHAWLRYFRFGPLEWVWRSVVYLRRQPMRLEPLPDRGPALEVAGGEPEAVAQDPARDREVER